MPAMSEVKINEIEEIWHISFVIDVTEEKHCFQYFGPALAEIFGEDFTTEDMEEALDKEPLLANSIGYYPKVIETRQPALDASAFQNNNEEIRYRSIIVPLSNDGENVHYLLGTTNYKSFHVEKQ
jgi:hypothetical protein